MQLPGAGAVDSNGLLRFFGDDTHLLSAVGNQVVLWDLAQVDRLAQTTTTPLASACDACPGAPIAVSPHTKNAAIAASVPGTGSEIIVQSLPGTGVSQYVIPGLAGIPIWRDVDHLLIVTTKPESLNQTPLPSAVTAVTAGDSRTPVLTAALEPDGKHLIVVNARGAIYISKIQTLAQCARRYLSRPIPNSTMKISPTLRLTRLPT